MGHYHSTYETSNVILGQDDLDLETAYSVPNWVHLDGSQIVEMMDEGITQGVPFMLNEEGTYRPKGKKRKLNMIDSVAALHKTSVIARFSKTKGGSMEFKYDALYDTLLTIGVRHLDIENVPRTGDGASLLTASSVSNLDYHRFGQYILPSGIGKQFDSRSMDGYKYIHTGGDTPGMSTIYTGADNSKRIKTSILTTQDYFKFFHKTAQSVKPSSTKPAQIIILLEPQLPEPVIYTMSKNSKRSEVSQSVLKDLNAHTTTSFNSNSSLFGSMSKLLNPYNVLASNNNNRVVGSVSEEDGEHVEKGNRNRNDKGNNIVNNNNDDLYSDSYVTRECSLLNISGIQKEEIEEIPYTTISFNCTKQTITIDKDDSKKYTYAPLFGVCIDKIGNISDAENDTSDCSICLSEPREFACLPCRHLSMCSTCVKDLAANNNKCPICRNPAQLFLKLPLKIYNPKLAKEQIVGGEAQL